MQTLTQIRRHQLLHSNLPATLSLNFTAGIERLTLAIYPKTDLSDELASHRQLGVVREVTENCSPRPFSARALCNPAQW